MTIPFYFSVYSWLHRAMIANASPHVYDPPLQRSSTNIKTALRKSTDKIPLPLMTTQHFWYQCLGRESCILLGFPRIQCISTVVIGSSHLSVKSPQAGAIQLPDTHPLEKRARSHITQDKPPLKTSSTYT